MPLVRLNADLPRDITAPRPAKTRRRRQARSTVSPQLSVIIVNYGQWRETASLTRQLLTTPEARRQAVEVVIIDNHSPPSRLMHRLRRWPGVSLRRWRHNRGFARAVNEGARLSRGSWYLLLNPDMTLEAGFLAGVQQVIASMEVEKPRTGIVGFKLRNNDGSLQGSAGSFPTLASTLTGLLRPRSRRKYDTPPLNQATDVAWVTGCCLLIRRECLEQLKGLDDSFFLYYEDVDLCRRAQKLGWSVRFEPGLSAVHHRPLHSRPVAPLIRLCTRHALLVYSLKHWSRWQFRLLSGVIRLETWFRRRRAVARRESDLANRLTEFGQVLSDLERAKIAVACQRLRRILASAA